MRGPGHVGDDGATARMAGVRREPPRFLRYWTPAYHNREPEADDDPPGDPPAAAPELDCLHGILAPDLLNAAARRADDLGVSADRVLIQWGAIAEDAYLARLALHLDIPLINLTRAARADCPLPDRQFVAAASTGVLPLRRGDDLRWVVAPTVQTTARALCERQRRWRDPRLRLTSAAVMQQYLADQGAHAIGQQAAFDLQRRWSVLSAGPQRDSGPIWRQRLMRGLAVLGVVLAVPLLAPETTATLLALWFIGFAAFRLVACFWPSRPLRRRLRRPDDALPIYTVIAALYREANCAGQLVAALEAFDYPPEKLDIILVLEPNDRDTHAALARLGPRPHLRVLTAPPIGPQTKPKALNWALAFARGDFIAVYDAEDRPEPGQLRAALDAFDQHGPTTACVQASLSIDNRTHSWLSMTFLAEYAGQFDLLLHGLTALGAPLPLGGTSNHFRVPVLRAIGGWDPYNVTEDADLGFRLARFGYRAAAFASTTFEEAPVTFGNWLPQRARWMKGFIQTGLVHLRHPLRLWRQIGGRGVATLGLLVGGHVVGALAYLALLAVAGLALAAESVPLPAWLQPAPPTALHCCAVMAGFVSTIVVGVAGLARRGRLRFAPVLLLTPLYWLCLSLAAWRALAQFVWAPYRWDKTEHGVAARAPASADAAGQTGVRGSASDPRRPLRASASC
ncbi:MAG: glycosyltransferase [Rhodopseudomonas palustris]|uniref:Glycosyltransferase n=1 Tax=Rhodopseudomonas palustris TaxID=1076 RepID=A0A933S365_RHOPL|nr:glycosyltransferase [Rhodopseudomonas palustris]